MPSSEYFLVIRYRYVSLYRTPLCRNKWYTGQFSGVGTVLLDWITQVSLLTGIHDTWTLRCPPWKSDLTRHICVCCGKDMTGVCAAQGFGAPGVLTAEFGMLGVFAAALLLAWCSTHPSLCHTCNITFYRWGSNHPIVTASHPFLHSKSVQRAGEMDMHTRSVLCPLSRPSPVQVLLQVWGKHPLERQWCTNGHCRYATQVWSWSRPSQHMFFIPIFPFFVVEFRDKYLEGHIHCTSGKSRSQDWR